MHNKNLSVQVSEEVTERPRLSSTEELETFLQPPPDFFETHPITRFLSVTPSGNAGQPSPDYTFIARDLRAIVDGTAIQNKAPSKTTPSYAFSPNDLEN